MENESNTPGRPPVSRHSQAGKNVRLALKILGKTWRRNTESPDHVLNWEKWTTCRLPRSSTTIDRDILEGVPESRISSYARCLGITPDALMSEEADLYTILGELEDASEALPTPALSYKDHFPEQYLKHNSESYIRDLFALMNGVYRMSYVLQEVDTIHRCCIWIHKAEAYRLEAQGLFIMFGVENHARGNIFRWHNNLHLHYLCHNGMELGYIMTVDPLRHNLVSRRNPFWLKGRGLTDRGLADNQPITFTLHLEKLPMAEGLSQQAVWEQECEALRQRPFIAPGESDYQETWNEITTPDVLV